MSIRRPVEVHTRSNLDVRRRPFGTNVIEYILPVQGTSLCPVGRKEQLNEDSEVSSDTWMLVSSEIDTHGLVYIGGYVYVYKKIYK